MSGSTMLGRKRASSLAGPLWLFRFLSSLIWEVSGLEVKLFQCQGRIKIDATASPITRNTTSLIILSPVHCFELTGWT